MKATIRCLFITALATAVSAFIFLNPASSEKGDPSPPDELEYPVVLIHGLGEGPGAAAFGKLEEYLEDYYFDVEVMDFNSYKKHKLAEDKDVGELGILAAVFGMEIKKILKQYNTDKVHIVAHSYGGLIAQAFILNYGEEYAKRKGGKYEGQVDKIVYLQTPFYGTTYDADTLQQLVAQTDYGPYLKQVPMLRTLTPGSDWIYNMHDKLMADNIYKDYDGVDAVTFVSSEDEVISNMTTGILGAFMWKGDTHPFHRYRIFGGRFGKYCHTSNPLSQTDPKSKSLAYIEEIADPNFIGIASFLDNGRNWRKVGLTLLDRLGFMMFKYDNAKGFKVIDEEDILLKFKKKATEELTGAKPAVKRGQYAEPFFNELSRVYVFTDLPPGTYQVTCKNQHKEDLQVDVELEDGLHAAYLYDPKKNELLEAGRKVFGDLGGLFSIDEIQITKANTYQSGITGLNTNGFEIEFEISGCPGSNWPEYDKMVILSLSNGSGSYSVYNGRDNGSRVEIVARNAGNPTHGNKVHLNLGVDKDKDGHLDDEDFEEHKEGHVEWTLTNNVKLRIFTASNGECVAQVWVNGQFIFDITKSKPYWNPNPQIHIGGHVIHEVYKPPIGATIRRLIVRNITAPY